MKIDPKHDYKKPLYAIGAAALIGASAILGAACTDPLAYGGETETLVTRENESCKPDADKETVLVGEMTIETDIELAGDVAEET